MTNRPTRFTGFTRFAMVPAFAFVAVAVLVGLPWNVGGRLRAQAEAAPTFSRDIAPILFNKCGVCHHPGGAAPFSVLTYTEARQHATLMADLTKRRIMPPWQAEPGDNEFVGLEPLSSEEVDRIQRWVANGSPEGDPRTLPPVPQWNADWQLGAPDLILTLPQSYALPGEGTDVFRVFVFPLRVDARKYVRGIEFHPGNPRVVHHATIRVDTTPTSRRRDEEDPAPGYDGLLAHSAVYPDGHFLAWTPGQVPPLLPNALTWTLNPGTDLVVQLHFQPSGKVENVQPVIGIYFGSDPPTRTPTMIRLGRQNFEIPAGARAHMVTDSYVLPVDVDVQAVQPHAHYRGRVIKGVATLPDGTTKSLIRISDWNFRWQHVYRYAKPFTLPKGTKVEMQFLYDNSADNPRNTLPLERVVWGQRSSDEMGDLWIQVLTANEGDRQTLNNDYLPKMLAEDIVGSEMRIRVEPNRVALRDDAALQYLMANQPEKAVTHFRAAMALAPGAAETHFNLATALTLAATRARAATGMSMLDEAVAEYRRALDIRPDYAAARTNLGGVQLERGSPQEALIHLTEAVRLDPRSAEAQYSIGRAERALNKRAEAIQSFRRALALRSNWAPVVNDLAFLLATSPEDGLRNAAEALRLAQLANALTGGQDPAALDVLAAAYAESGQYESAVQYAQDAVRRAPPGRAQAIVAERLELYRRGKPYRIQ